MIGQPETAPTPAPTPGSSAPAAPGSNAPVTDPGKIPQVVEQMIALGKNRSYLSYDDLNNTLPDNWIEPERV
ncbi:MAG: RNA polymerase sigma factor region1.1 domain-containing protein, partial [Phycisphaeraceae bacterium]